MKTFMLILVLAIGGVSNTGIMPLPNCFPCEDQTIAQSPFPAPPIETPPTR